MTVNGILSPSKRNWPVPGRFRLHPTASPGRPRAEAFITGCFREAYGADIRHFMPELLSLEDESGVPQAVLGFRSASDERLFLEQYLDTPIEVTLGARLLTHVARAKVMEVGNLATVHAGGARWLIAALTAYLKGLGCHWAVFTAVPALANAFSRLGIRLTTLGFAQRHQLPLDEQARWGTYYDCQPLVVAASVEQSYGALRPAVGPNGGQRVLEHLFRQAYAHGEAARYAVGL